MNQATPIPDLGTPPQNYDFRYMLTTIQQIVSFMQAVQSPGALVEATLALTTCPTNGGGLRPGAVWQDGSGVLRIVRSTDALAVSFRVPMKVGKAVAA